jgi:hypothetical protein
MSLEQTKRGLLCVAGAVVLATVACTGPSNVGSPGGGGAGAGGGGTGAGGSGAGSAVDYFPLVLGASWTYQVTDGQTVIGEKTQTVKEYGQHPQVSGETFTLETSKPGGDLTVSYQRVEGDDVVRLLEEIYKNNAFDGGEVYEPSKLRVSNSMVSVGQTRTETYNEQVLDALGMVTSSLDKTEIWTVDAIESVTVPAGTFDNAARIHREGTTTGSDKTYWFVSGVGKIKEVAANQTEDLSAYTIP